MCSGKGKGNRKLSVKMCFIIDVDQEVLVCYFYLHRVMNFRKKKYQGKGRRSGKFIFEDRVTCARSSKVFSVKILLFDVTVKFDISTDQ